MPIVDYNRLVDKLRKYFPSQGNMEALGDAIDQAGRGMPPQIGAPLSMAGMVLNPKTIGKFQILLKTALAKRALKQVPKGALSKSEFKQVLPDLLEDTDLAIEFVKQKYPKFFANAHDVRVTNPQFSFAGEDMGGYDLRSNIGYIPNNLKNSYEAVDSTAHELTHALQNKRDPIGLNTAYWPASAGFKKYESQPWEVDARRGGATAKAAYEKMLKLLLQQERNYLPANMLGPDKIRELVLKD